MHLHKDWGIFIIGLGVLALISGVATGSYEVLSIPAGYSIGLLGLGMIVGGFLLTVLGIEREEKKGKGT